MISGVERAPLTTRQAEVLAYISDFIVEYSYPPTLRQAMRQFGISSPNGMLCHFRALEAKGYIAHDANVSRGIRLLDPPETRTEKVARLRRQLAEIEAELAAAIAEGE